jgi:hypothetical protein
VTLLAARYPFRRIILATAAVGSRRLWAACQNQRVKKIDPEDFNPGYLMRGMHLLPNGGDQPEWHTQDYRTEKDELLAADLDGGALVYE